MTDPVLRVNRIFRDDEETDYVGIVRALRGFEVEFEVYGTVYWKDGQRNYLVSANAETLNDHVTRLSREGCYPVPPQIYSERMLVPAGCDSELEEQVKLNCCRRLRATYPPSFWDHARDVADGRGNDSALPLLSDVRDRLKGVFDADSLQLFEALVNRAFLRRNLEQHSYAALMAWLEEERRCMADDGFERSLFVKDMYGFATRDANGTIRVAMDSVRMNAEGKRRDSARKDTGTVTPLFHARVGYNRNYRLVDARNDFKARLASLFDGEYFALLEKLDALPVAVDIAGYQRECERLSTAGDAELLELWKHYGRQWGITS